MWFKTYGFKENPFKITPKPEYMVGYESQEIQAKEAITSGDIIVITGPTGYGKTTLLRKLKNWAARQGYKTVYFDCTYSPSDQVNFRELLSVKTFFGLRKRLPVKKDRIVLFLDEVQRLGKDKLEELKYYYDSERIHSIVMSTISHLNVHESMRTRVAETVKLCNLTAHDLRSMILKRVEKGKNPFSPDGIEEIVLLSGNNPRSVLINAEKVCKVLHTSFPEGNIGREEVLYVLKGEKTGWYKPVEVKEIVSEEREKGDSVQDTAQEAPVFPDSLDSEKPAVKAENTSVSAQQDDLVWAWELKDLSPLQKKIVKVLAEAGRPLSYEEICPAVGAGKGSVAKQLSRLALVSDTELMNKKGITEPVVSKIVADGKSLFELTEKYRKLLARE